MYKQLTLIMPILYFLQPWGHIERKIGDAVFHSKVGGVKHDGRGDILTKFCHTFIERGEDVFFSGLHLYWNDIVP